MTATLSSMGAFEALAPTDTGHVSREELAKLVADLILNDRDVGRALLQWAVCCPHLEIID